MRGAGRQLKAPFAIAGLCALAACGRSADAVPAAAASSQVRGAPAAGPTSADVPRVGSRADTETTCGPAPLGVRVVAVRRETADSIRVELSVANLTAPGDWRPGSPVAASVRAAVDGFERVSLLSADGRRRMFPLHDGTGQRVGRVVPAPVPGKPETFSALFPAAEGPVSLVLPGCAPLSGLAVAPLPGRSEP